MHVRQTDLNQHLLKKSNGRRKNTEETFVRFVESRPVDEKVFLLTDNPQTQEFFLNKYGPQKILVYSKMNDDKVNNLPLRVMGARDLYHKGKFSRFLLPLFGLRVTE